MPPRSRLASRLLAAAASLGIATLAAGAVAEGWLRREPLPLPPMQAGADQQGACIEPSLTRGYAPRPGHCGADDHGDVSWRFPGEPTRTVLLLGDSVGIHRWVQATGEALAPALAPAGLELRNTSVSGYDTCQEAATWEERLADPDLLVLQSCPNDLLVTPTVARLPGDRIRYFGPKGAVTLPAVVLRSRLLLTLGLAAGERWWLEPGAKRTDDTARGCLAALQDSAARAHVPLLVLFFPGFDGGPRKGGEATQERWYAELGLDVIDIRAVLTRRDPALLVSRDGVHPDSPAQTAALAELLAPELLARLGPAR